MNERDPVRAMDDGSRDLYDIATWERRTPLDRVAAAIYGLLRVTFRATVVVVAFLILLGIGGLSALTDPQVGTLTALSAIPAFGLAFYVYYSDTTSGEPLAVLVATFLLGILTANFAAVVNTLLGPLFDPFGFLGMVVMFFLVVGPVEETVKLLAVRLYAYGRPTFDCVIDGAVYGAMAGLGFATVENSLFITRQVGDLGMGVGVLELIGVGGGITAVRALAGPGHVIYSAVAGYYLGLAKFNPENRGPIIVKGLLIAAFIHATYNSTVGIGSSLIAGLLGVPPLVGFIGYVIVYDGVWGLYLLRKIRRYSETFHRLDRAEDDDPNGTAEPVGIEAEVETAAGNETE
jgi:RsiW-degrading membrane proteinase PrsW (M82 family)